MRKTARFLVEKGFTLVELLIVIALIGVLAVAVLAAINPLEQLNRARDTGMESDASQLLAAIDRYYASQEEFPWVTVYKAGGTGGVANNDAAYGFTSAQVQAVGVCGADCTADGVLLMNLELKSEFRKRKFITTTDTTGTELLYIGKAQGASTSVYSCWVPKSRSNRAKATQTLTVGSTAMGTAADCVTRTYASLDTSCVICIPR